MGTLATQPADNGSGFLGQNNALLPLDGRVDEELCILWQNAHAQYNICIGLTTFLQPEPATPPTNLSPLRKMRLEE